MRLAASHGEWIEFREDLSRDELNRLMGRSRYGIQAMENEHFGMATAEMTRAGCLVFAHDSGGSPEVLNNERRIAVGYPRTKPFERSSTSRDIERAARAAASHTRNCFRPKTSSSDSATSSPPFR